MPPEIIIPLIVCAIITIAFLTYYFGKEQVVLRGLKKFKFKEILQFRTNEPTKITGKVLHVHEPFIAPFSKRKCVAYQIKIRQKKGGGKNSYWKTLIETKDIQDFFIEKKGEVVMIKPSKSPQNYKSYFVEDKTAASGFLNDPSAEFQEVLKAYGIKSENLLGFNKKLRYSERILEVGETVTVGGIAKWKVLDTKITGYNYSKIAALESDDKNKIIITDLPIARAQT